MSHGSAPILFKETKKYTKPVYFRRRVSAPDLLIFSNLKISRPIDVHTHTFTQTHDSDTCTTHWLDPDEKSSLLWAAMSIVRTCHVLLINPGRNGCGSVRWLSQLGRGRWFKLFYFGAPGSEVTLDDLLPFRVECLTNSIEVKNPYGTKQNNWSKGKQIFNCFKPPNN